MEATAAAATMVGSSFGMYRTSIPLGRLCFSATSRPYLFRFQTKQLSSLSFAKPEDRRVPLGIRRGFVVRASSSSSSSSSDPAGSIAPLRMESPIGQFLSQILVSHPHLVPAAVEQQLDQLQTDRDAEKQTEEEQSSAGTDLVLYRRIAEVKANERRKALEEILYALVVQKFMDANVSLVPGVAPSSTDVSDRVDTWPIQDEKLEQLHSPEAYEMIQNHLALILGNRLEDSTSIAQISKLRVGQVYAASVMYGYFLRRVDQRFQLEKTVKILSNAINEKETNGRQSMEQNTRRGIGEDSFRGVSSHPEAAMSGGFNPAGGAGSNIKPSRLRTYVMSFDGDTLKNYATIRSKEAVSIIEKHTEALFGRPEIVITPGGSVDSSNDDLIKISFGGLKRLVLEAVTFGSFLWDVESYVDSRYHFVVS